MLFFRSAADLEVFQDAPHLPEVDKLVDHLKKAATNSTKLS